MSYKFSGSILQAQEQTYTKYTTTINKITYKKYTRENTFSGLRIEEKVFLMVAQLFFFPI